MIRSQQLQMLHEQEKRMREAQNLSIIETDTKIWCPICRRPHSPGEMGSILMNDSSNGLMEDARNESGLAPPGDEVNQSNFDWKPINNQGHLSRYHLISSVYFFVRL